MRTYLIRFFAVAAACLLLPPGSDVHAQENAALARLRAAVERELGPRLFTRSMAAIEISDLSSGTILYSKNAELLLRPASNAKLFASAAALRALDAKHAFETRVFIDTGAPPRTVWIQGSGDPLFTSEDIQKLAEMTAVASDGRFAAVMLDGNIFDTLAYAPGWMWDDLPGYFAPVLSAFPCDGNKHQLSFTAPLKHGEAIIARQDDACAHTRVVVGARSAGGGELTISADIRRSTILVSGSMRAGARDETEVTVWDPPAAFHCRFLRELEKRGVTVVDANPRSGTVPGHARLLATRQHTLDDVLRSINTDSDNLSAESLLKTLAAASTKQAGSTADGITEMLKQAALIGVDTAAVKLVDGSGMSFYNLVSASAIGQLLRGMYKSAERGRFLASMAVMGKKGTLAKRLAGTAAAGLMAGKTGTVSGVSALSGYVLAPETTLGVVMLMQNFSGAHAPYRAVQDRIVLHCLEYGATRSR